MTWLWVTIIAYAILGFVSVVDRYLLSGPLPSPKAYTFYVGSLGMFVFLLTPIFGLTVLPGLEMAVAFLSGFLFVAALFFLYSGLHKFEASRVVPAMGGLIPIFTLIFSFLVFREGVINGTDLVAFILLIFGSITITIKREKKITLPSLKFAGGAALLFALSFVLAKYVYLTASFWSPFVWMRVGGFIFAAGIFAFSHDLRRTLFTKKTKEPKRTRKTAVIFLGNQVLGAGGSVLQNVAIFLVPALHIAFVSALEGIIYVFVLIYTALASIFLPHLINEVFTKKTALQKAVATVLIVAGILILSLSGQ
ncbi:MAG: DMT family transporter [Patescibacteria group bacterium]|nr:DMT family transporter [Patescibacteria group bacterium]